MWAWLPFIFFYFCLACTRAAGFFRRWGCRKGQRCKCLWCCSSPRNFNSSAAEFLNFSDKPQFQSLFEQLFDLKVFCIGRRMSAAQQFPLPALPMMILSESSSPCSIAAELYSGSNSVRVLWFVEEFTQIARWAIRRSSFFLAPATDDNGSAREE